MNKYLLLLFLPLLSFIMAGCDDDKEDVQQIDLDRLAGTWKVVEQGSQNVFERDCCLEIAVFHDSPNGAYGGYLVFITTFYLANGNPVHDKVYSGSIREVENHYPLLNLEFDGDHDNNDDSKEKYTYTITRLDYTYMWWSFKDGETTDVIKFRRL